MTEEGYSWGVAPEPDRKILLVVCGCSLRTQQRADSQRQSSTPGARVASCWPRSGSLREKRFGGCSPLPGWVLECRIASCCQLLSSRLDATKSAIGIYGEFDPGSGRTLAACLTHASRTVNRLRPGISGERVSNTWATCPRLWDNPGKPGLIPDTTAAGIRGGGKISRSGMGPRPISLLVG
jgi:hypothetical protein